MTDKTIQERLREFDDGPGGHGWKLCCEAADLIDRLTAPASEDVVERVAISRADLIELRQLVSICHDMQEEKETLPILGRIDDALAARDAIAAMPSEDEIRRDEREKCAKIADREAKSNREVAEAHKYAGNWDSCAERFRVAGMAERLARAIRARSEENIQ